MIKAYDGQIVHNTYIDALVAQEMRRLNAERDAAEAEFRTWAEFRIKQLEHELAQRKNKEVRLYSMIMDDNGMNRGASRISFLGKAAWAIVGWVLLAADGIRKCARRK